MRWGRSAGTCLSVLKRKTLVNELIPFADIKQMAAAIGQSKMFGQSPEQALALMLVAQAEGRHPAIVARDYHIIQGRPSLKADAMLARFQQEGGRVKWHALTDSIADATWRCTEGDRGTACGLYLFRSDRGLRLRLHRTRRQPDQTRGAARPDAPCRSRRSGAAGGDAFRDAARRHRN